MVILAISRPESPGNRDRSAQPPSACTPRRADPRRRTRRSGRRRSAAPTAGRARATSATRRTAAPGWVAGARTRSRSRCRSRCHPRRARPRDRFDHPKPPTPPSPQASADGSIAIGIDVDPLDGRADSGDLELDLSELLVELGKAAAEETTDGTASSGRVAARVGKSHRDLSTSRDHLIRRGLIYAPARGLVAFTIPGMAAFIRNNTDWQRRSTIMGMSIVSYTCV